MFLIAGAYLPIILFVFMSQSWFYIMLLYFYFLQSFQLSIQKIVCVLLVVACLIECNQSSTVVQDISIFGRIDRDEVAVHHHNAFHHARCTLVAIDEWLDSGDVAM